MNEQIWFDDLNKDDDVNSVDGLQGNGEQPMDFALLMSLALDDLLDDEQQREFEYDLATYPLLAERWSLWQKVDQKLLEEPYVEPPQDFAQTFKMRLVQQERRRRLWFGLAVGSLSVTLWACMTLGLITGGGYVLVSQGDLLGQVIHNSAYFLSVVTNWFQTLSNTTGTILNTPQAYGILLGYALLSALILTGWTRLLRKSTGAPLVS